MLTAKRTLNIAELGAKFRPTRMGSHVVHLIGTDDPVYRALCGKKPRRTSARVAEGEVTCFDCVVRYERGDKVCV